MIPFTPIFQLAEILLAAAGGLFAVAVLIGLIGGTSRRGAFAVFCFCFLLLILNMLDGGVSL